MAISLSFKHALVRSRRSRLLAAACSIALVAQVVSMVAFASTANATGTGSGVSYTLEGCRNNGGITLPNLGGRFLCPDAAYTTGNLGKGWNELDLVPIRVTLGVGGSAPSTQTLAFAIGVDNCSIDNSAAPHACTGGRPGYDVLGSDAANGWPVLNASLSSGNCGTLTATGQQYTTASSLYRIMTVTGIAKSSTCVYDAYGRLALGSHLWPGSSLHFNLFNDQLTTSGVGAKEVSIPVKEILPQTISKSMSASQGSDSVWSVTKTGPASVNLGDSCLPGFSSGSGTITVTWTKSAGAAGKITITTIVSATNPASRPIDVSISDNVFLNGTGAGSAAYTLSASATVPANTTQPIINDTRDVDPPSADGMVSDFATATYTDAATGIPVPGNTTTSKAVSITAGSATNGSAVITDNEHWATVGSGLSFSVAAPSTGSFTNYTAGTQISDSTPVLWSSGTVTTSGSVTFTKTFYGVTANVSSGTVTDTATATTSGNVVTNSDPLNIPVSSSATTSLTVSKSTSLKISSAQTFTFHLQDASTAPPTDLGTTATVNMPALSNGPVSSNTITGLSPTGSYNFLEDATAPYNSQTTGTATFSLVAGDVSTCSKTLSVQNNAAPVTAQVKKVTDPASSGLWTFTLTGPNGLSETLSNVQAGAAAYSLFNSSIDVDGGTYTITETQQANYDLTNIVGDLSGGSVSTSIASKTCSFTLNLATDSGKTFECTFTNTLRGHIIIKKKTYPAGGGPFSFNASYNASGFSLSDGGSNDSGALVPGTYSVSENALTGWDNTGASCDDGSPVSAISLQAGETVTCTFTNTQRGTIIVKKITDPTSSTQKFAFTGDAAGSIGNGESITVGNLAPGTYTSTEGALAGWDLTGISCDDAASATPSTTSGSTATFKLDPGETITCTFTNRQRGHVKVIKTVAGLPPTGTDAFTFELRSGASASAAGTVLETGTANVGNGGVINFATNLVPGTTYQLCEQMLPAWMTSLGPPLYSVYNPSGDNSVVCTDFTVAAGQTKTFSIDNTRPPGGMALTIGYWKNHASCAASNGKQQPVLDQTLLAAANAGSPITLGLLVLNPLTLGAATACKDAVNILNKTTIDGKKKMASDPLFNMAAQLLAADLNIAAGAGSCASAVSAITQAHTLLSKYSFNGLTYTPKLTPADATLANNLAATLDLYNNNKLC